VETISLTFFDHIRLHTLKGVREGKEGREGGKKRGGDIG
jgi:hypothetical protein